MHGGEEFTEEIFSLPPLRTLEEKKELAATNAAPGLGRSCCLEALLKHLN